MSAFQDQLLSGVVSRSTPLIDFYTILDIDFGLVSLVLNQFFNEDVYDSKYRDISTKELIQLLYYRFEKNPLYTIAKKDVDKTHLNTLYLDFIEKQEDSIYSFSILREDVLNMISIFNSAKEITNPTILCYHEKQLEILNSIEELDNNAKIILSDKTELDKYNQFFIKDIDSLVYFLDLQFKTFYIASEYSNFNKDLSDLKNQKLSEDLIRNKNRLNIFNLYNVEILKKEET